MKAEKTIYQIIKETRIGEKLVIWYDDETQAKTELQELETMFPDENYRIEEGTDYIYKKCRCCQSVYAEMRFDHYGIETGVWCDDCYNDPSEYTYRKDAYFDPSYAGEHLYPED